MNTTKTAFALAIGAAFTASLALTEAARAADNPFSMQNLSQGYLLANAAGKIKDGKCGEGKCGDKKTPRA
ncbi:MAG TPA: hypothetical protein DEP05_08855 [Betaproteobacteria bacterium]|nr:hypothetical protein [Betaproteobacteria bacterium]